jgi:hypothetical protein
MRLSTQLEQRFHQIFAQTGILKPLLLFPRMLKRRQTMTSRRQRPVDP